MAYPSEGPRNRTPIESHFGFKTLKTMHTRAFQAFRGDQPAFCRFLVNEFLFLHRQQTDHSNNLGKSSFYLATNKKA